MYAIKPGGTFDASSVGAGDGEAARVEEGTTLGCVAFGVTVPLGDTLGPAHAATRNARMIETGFIG
jgi:hypothetical protein